jgi:hypothetical protein
MAVMVDSVLQEPTSVPDAAELEILQRNPVLFIERFLGSELWAKQSLVADMMTTHKKVAVRSCHGSGKTYLAARIALWWLFTRPFSTVLTTAPSNRQVVELLWKEIRVAYSNARVKLGGNMLPKAPKLTVADDWMLIGFSTDDPVNFQGWHSKGGTLVIFDEAPGVHSDIWKVVQGVMVSDNDRLLCIGNPVEPFGPFCDMFKDADVGKVHISAYDTPNVRQGVDVVPGLCSSSWVDEKRKEWGEDSPIFQSRVLGEFPSTHDAVVVPAAWVEQANDRYMKNMENGSFTDRSIHLGVDVARLGSDSTVVVEYVERLGVKKIIKLPKQDTMTTVGDVVNMARNNPVTSVNVDADGLGAGVFDRLVEVLSGRDMPLLVEGNQGKKGGMTSGSPDSPAFSGGWGSGSPVVRGLRGGTRARISDRFFNSRAEWYWTLREKLDPKNENPICLPIDNNLFHQLTSIRWRLNSKGQIRIEGKDEMRTRGMQSPDEADAVAYALAGEETFSSFILV